METSIIKSSYVSDLTSCHASSLDYCVLRKRILYFPRMKKGALPR